MTRAGVAVCLSFFGAFVALGVGALVFIGEPVVAAILGGLGLLTALAIKDELERVDVREPPAPASRLDAGGLEALEVLARRHPCMHLRRPEDEPGVLEGRMSGALVSVVPSRDLWRATCRVRRRLRSDHHGRVALEPGCRLGAPALAFDPAPLIARTRQTGRALERDAEGLALEVPLTVDEVERAVECLAGLGSLFPEDDAAPVVSARPREDAGVSCPYCRCEVQDDAAACEACGTLHHAACFREHGRCTVAACRGTRAAARRARA